jgi:hypothetical protein
MLTGLLLLPVLALAGQPTPASSGAARAPAATHETLLMGGLGFIGAVDAEGSDSAGGAALSLSLLHHLSFLEFGAELSGAAGLGGRVGGVGALLGLHLGSDFSVRALAVAGVHGYSAVGRGLLSDDPGIGGSMAYVGGRLVLGYAFGHKGRLFVGVLGMLDEDLERRRGSVTYTDTPWLLGDEPSTRTSHHNVGQTSCGILLTVGMGLDLTSY